MDDEIVENATLFWQKKRGAIEGARPTPPPTTFSQQAVVVDVVVVVVVWLRYCLQKRKLTLMLYCLSIRARIWSIVNLLDEGGDGKGSERG